MYTVFPPPILDRRTNRVVSRVLEREKYHDDPECRTRIQRSREQKVVLRPPREMPSPDDVLENEPHNRPWHEIDRRRGRDQRGPREDDR